MAEEVGRAFFVLETDRAKFERDLDAAERKASQTANSMGRSFKTMGQTLTTAGKTLTMGLTAPIVGLGAVSIKSALSFETSMNKIRFLTNVTADDLPRIEQAIFDTARATGSLPTETAGAFYFALSSGAKDAAQAQAILQQTLMAANLGLGESEVVTRAILSVINAYGLEMDEATVITGQFVEMIKSGLAEPDELATSLNRVLSVAKNMNVAIPQLFSGISALTVLTGASGPRAISKMAGAFRSLLRQSDKQKELFKEVGGEMSNLLKLVEEDFGLAMKEIFDRFSGNTAAIKKFVGSTEALDAVLSIGSKRGFAVYSEALGNMAGAGEDWIKTQEEFRTTTEFMLKSLKSDFSVALIELGRGLVPVLKPTVAILGIGIKVLTRLGKAFQKLPKPVQFVIIGFALLLAILGPMMLIVGLIISVIPGLVAGLALLKVGFIALNASIALGPIGLLILALVALVVIGVLVFKNWDKIANFFRKIVMPAFEDLGEATKVLWKNLIIGVIAFKDVVIDAFGKVLDFVRKRWPEIVTLLSGPFLPLVLLATDAFGIRSLLIRALKSLVLAVFDIGKDIVGELKKGFVAGTKSFFRMLKRFLGEVKKMLNPLNWHFSPDTLLDIYRDAGQKAGQALGEGIESGLNSAHGPIQAVREAIMGLHDELGRLTQLPTRGSVKQELRLAQLRLKLLRAGEPERIENELEFLQQMERAGFSSADGRRRKKQLELRVSEVDAIKDEIAVLERAVRERGLENEILELRGLLADQTIVSDQEMQRAAEDLILRIEGETRALNEQVSVIWTQYIPALNAMGDSLSGVGDEMEDLTNTLGDISELEFESVTRGIRGLLSQVGDFIAMRAPDPLVFATFLGFRGASTAEILRALELVGTLPSRPIQLLPEPIPTPIPVPTPPATPTPISEAGAEMNFWAPFTVQVPAAPDRFAEELYRTLAEE